MPNRQWVTFEKVEIAGRRSDWNPMKILTSTLDDNFLPACFTPQLGHNLFIYLFFLKKGESDTSLAETFIQGKKNTDKKLEEVKGRQKKMKDG